jgi:hypothetical protein
MKRRLRWTSGRFTRRIDSRFHCSGSKPGSDAGLFLFRTPDLPWVRFRRFIAWIHQVHSGTMNSARLFDIRRRRLSPRAGALSGEALVSVQSPREAQRTHLVGTDHSTCSVIPGPAQPEPGISSWSCGSVGFNGHFEVRIQVKSFPESAWRSQLRNRVFKSVSPLAAPADARYFCRHKSTQKGCANIAARPAAGSPPVLTAGGVCRTRCVR